MINFHTSTELKAAVIRAINAGGDEYPRWLMDIALGVEGHYAPLKYDDYNSTTLFKLGIRVAEQMLAAGETEISVVFLDANYWFFKGMPWEVITQLQAHRVLHKD